MSHTTDLIAKYYQAFNAKNFEGMLELMDDEVVHDTNQGSRHIGKSNFREFLKRMDFLYDEHLENIVIMEDSDGTRAAAEFICQGIYKNTDTGLPPARGQKYRLPVGCFFEVKSGKIMRVTNYYNMNDWLGMVK